MPAANTIGGIVLCGGRSTRMGRSKALLPFGPELMLQRVVRILSEVVSPIIVVAARSQMLPLLPQSVRVAHDEQESLGPLAGLAAGLASLQGEVDAVYVSSCDVPLLKPAFVRQVIASLGDCDLAIPRDGEYHHPLAGVYSRRVETVVRDLLAANRLRPFYLLERVRAREIDVADLRQVDPDLHSLWNTNTPEQYAAALREAGFPSPTDAPDQ